MTMSDAARSPFPGSDLLAGAGTAFLRCMDLVANSWSKIAKSPVPPADGDAEDPVFARARELIEPAMVAPNVQALRRALADIALSTSYAELDLEISRHVSFDVSREPLELSERTKKRLGNVASSLVAEAMRLYHEAISMYGPERMDSELAELNMLNAEQLSEIRRRLVLGDVVHPDVSRMILSGLRGSVALVGISYEHPEWRMIALGESAVEGAMAIKQLIDVDLDKEADDYDAWKASVFARIENGEVVDMNDD